MTYSINYNTGAGDESGIATIDDAMDIADKGAAYTQQSIDIVDETGKEVMIRPWWGCLDGIEDASDPIVIGDLGYYGDWQ